MSSSRMGRSGTKYEQLSTSTVRGNVSDGGSELVVEAEAFLAETPESNRVRRYKIRDEQYREAVRQSASFAGALRLLGVVPEGGNYRVLRRAIKRLGLDTSHFAGQSWAKRQEGLSPRSTRRELPSNKYPINPIGYAGDSSMNASQPKCAGCKLDIWRDQPIPLELDHVDGNQENNAVEKLRLLCPHCHSLTPTFRGRNKRSCRRNRLDSLEGT